MHADELIENLTTIASAKGFLGREFLTWLWYASETRSQPLSIKSLKGGRNYQFNLWIDDRLVFETAATQGPLYTLKGGDPARSGEASVALNSGKSLRELRLGIRVDGEVEYTCILSSGVQDDGSLSPKSLRVTPVTDGPSVPDGDFVTWRLQKIEEFFEIVDALFSLFIDDRSGDTWDNEVSVSVKNWIQKKKSEKTLH